MSISMEEQIKRWAAIYRYRAKAEPTELQLPGGQNPSWCEGDEQADRAWYACRQPVN